MFTNTLPFKICFREFLPWWWRSLHRDRNSRMGCYAESTARVLRSRSTAAQCPGEAGAAPELSATRPAMTAHSWWHTYIHTYMYIRIKACGGCLCNEIIMIRYIHHTCSVPDRTESYNINFCIHTYIHTYVHNSCIQYLDCRCDTENQICTFYALNSVLTLKRIMERT